MKQRDGRELAREEAAAALLRCAACMPPVTSEERNSGDKRDGSGE